MKISTVFALVVAVGAAILVVSGCGSSGPVPITSPPSGPPNPTPAANSAVRRSQRHALRVSAAAESSFHAASHADRVAGLGLDAGNRRRSVRRRGRGQSQEIRLFHPPIVSFEPSHADLSIQLTPAITEIGAAATPIWLIWSTTRTTTSGCSTTSARRSPSCARRSPSRLQALFRSSSVLPGSKTAGYTTLGEGRFDVNAALYVYATNESGTRGCSRSVSRTPSRPVRWAQLGQADFVDSSQYLPTARIQPAFCSDSISARCARLNPARRLRRRST